MAMIKIYLLNIKIFFALLFLAAILVSQDNGKWHTGKGSAVHSDANAAKENAIKRARADALAQAGINIQSGSFRLQAENGNELNDFFSQMTEASSRGIILKEEPPKVGKPELISDKDYIFQVEAEIKAYVVIPKGEADPGFSVEMTANKKVLQEHENIKLSITSTKDGYLTILHVQKDTITVAFPNAVSKKNKITAKKKFVFPTEYDISMELEKNDKRVVEEFIAIVSKEDLPLAEIGESVIVNNELVVPKRSLNELSQWLFKVPVNQRAIAHVIVEIVK